MALLEVSRLCKSYPDGSRERCVLDDASFEIFDDDLVGLWGERQSGKSTLLRIIAGHEQPDRGRICFDGVDVTRLKSDRRVRMLRDRVALVSFAQVLSRSRTVVEHVALAAQADGGTNGRRARAKARAALHRLEVLNCAEHAFDRLSLDERVRIELARGLVRRPRLLLVDDPPRLQSPREGEDLDRLLISLGEDAGCALLVASCDLGLTTRTQRSMAIGRGRLRVMDTPATVVPFPSRSTGTGRT